MTPLVVSMSYVDPPLHIENKRPIYADLNLIMVDPTGWVWFGNDWEDHLSNSEKVMVGDVIVGDYELSVISPEYPLMDRTNYSMEIGGRSSTSTSTPTLRSCGPQLKDVSAGSAAVQSHSGDMTARSRWWLPISQSTCPSTSRQEGSSTSSKDRQRLRELPGASLHEDQGRNDRAKNEGLRLQKWQGAELHRGTRLGLHGGGQNTFHLDHQGELFLALWLGWSGSTEISVRVELK
jgi:hypothetical protein